MTIRNGNRIVMGEIIKNNYRVVNLMSITEQLSFTTTAAV